MQQLSVEKVEPQDEPCPETKIILHPNGQWKRQYSLVGKIRVGLWREWFENGQLAMQESFGESGMRTGPSREWFENGTPQSEYYYEDNVLQGPFKIWHKNGLLAEHGEYLNDKKFGPNQEWHENGVLKSRGEYIECIEYKGKRAGQDEVKHGKWEYFNHQGLLVLKEIWQNGEVIRMKKWDDAGRKESKVNYITKERCAWFPNGRLKKQEIEGAKRKWYPKKKGGRPRIEKYYNKDDELDGPCTKWWPNGKRMIQGCYVDGQRKGWLKEWNKNGELIKKVQFSLHDEM